RSTTATCSRWARMRPATSGACCEPSSSGPDAVPAAGCGAFSAVLCNRRRTRDHLHLMDLGESLSVRLVGDDSEVPCVDGRKRRYVGLDAAASTGALPSVADRVQDFVPSYSSVHRGAGPKSQMATTAYEEAREAALRFAGRAGGGDHGDVAIICRNTTE